MVDEPEDRRLVTVIDPANVFISREKLTGYLLSRTHPVGSHKSVFFLGLGYKAEEPDVLAADLTRLLISAAQFGDVTEHGQKVLARGPIQGPNGQIGRVLVVWIILAGESLIRFVTAYPEG